jgi:rhamnosyltransferase subunit B
MNILLVPVGSHGDVHPFVGMGLGLKQRGHAISLLANEVYRPLAEKHGFDFAPIGTVEDYHRLTHDPLLWHPSKSLRAVFVEDLLRQYLPLTYRAIESRYVRGQTAVLAGSLGFAPRIAHEKLGVPLATIHLQPISIASVADPPQFPASISLKWFPKPVRRMLYWYIERIVVDGYLAGPVNDFRQQLGLAPIRRIWGNWRHSPQLILGLFPNWFASAPDWPLQMQQTGFIRYDEGESPELPAGLELFLNAGEPPVVVSFGSAMRQARPHLEAAVEACRRLGLRCVLLAKNGDQIPPNLPEGCRQFDYAPFSRVFPRAAAVIHHGGVGTTAQALSAAVPQLVMPMAFDQPDNAARLVRLGVAKSLPAAKFTAERATAILQSLLNDQQVRPACAKWASEMRADPLPRSCDLIESLQGRDV